jgi:hypothetical protein
MVAVIKSGKVALYSRNGKIISHSYIEVAKALEGVDGEAVIDGELVALDKEGVSHFQLLQNAIDDLDEVDRHINSSMLSSQAAAARLDIQVSAGGSGSTIPGTRPSTSIMRTSALRRKPAGARQVF